jgi:hypothetical protein
MEWFADSREAIEARFAAERVEAGRTEIVVLGSGSLDGMKRTHGKYFAGGREPDNAMPAGPA